MKVALRNLHVLLCASAVTSDSFFLLVATSDSIDMTLRASVTERVPSAEDLRPVKGKLSGLCWHWQFKLTAALAQS